MELEEIREQAKIKLFLSEMTICDLFNQYQVFHYRIHRYYGLSAMEWEIILQHGDT